jgi:hypothetical protein
VCTETFGPIFLPLILCDFTFLLLFLNSETDQLYKICTVLGTPDCTIWPEGMNLPRSCSFKFFQVNLSSIWTLGSLD